MKKYLLSVLIAGMAGCFTVNAQRVLLKTGNSTLYNAPNKVQVGNNYYFLSSVSGKDQIWKTDGTPAGTVMVKEFTVTNSNNHIGNFANINDTFYFLDNTSNSTHAELWKSDGTVAGTVIVKSFTGTTSALVGGLTVINNTGYFVVQTSNPGYGGIWKTDGTTAGTVELKAGLSPNNNGFIKQGNNALFFGYASSNKYFALYKTDGTAVTMLKDSVVNPNQGQIAQNFTDVNGTLFFNIGNKGELWKSDGTVSGTGLVSTISNVNTFTAYGNMLYFNSFSGITREIWKSDGTPAGTKAEFTSYWLLGGMASYNGNLYLGIANGSYGQNTELSKGNGTEAGTALLKDINPGNGSSTPSNFLKVGNTLCFVATDGTYGSQVWQTDGTEANTTMAYASKDTITNFQALDLTVFNDNILFTQGRNLYILKIKASTATTLNAPSNLTVTPQKTYVVGKMLLQWTDNSSTEDGFVIERSTDGTAWSKIDSVNANTVMYTDQGLANGTAYYYRIAAYNAGSTSPYSNVVNATTLTTGINSLTNNTALFSAYPNPSNGIVQLSIPTLPANAIIKITDIMGSVVYNGTINANETSHTLDLDNLNNGIYLLQLTCGNEYKTQKLSISK